MGKSEVIWLTEERTFGVLVQMGAFYSLVRYTKYGNDYEVLIDNDEFESWEEDSVECDDE